MAQILKPNADPLQESGTMEMPALNIPSFKNLLAIERGVEKNLLVQTNGGVGDVVCAEPAIRFALDTYKNSNVSILTRYPELFSHLERHIRFKKIYKDCDEGAEKVDASQHLIFKSLRDPDDFYSEFVNHLNTQCVDYASLIMWRCQMSPEQRQIKLLPSVDDYCFADNTLNRATDIVIHPGRGWASKTFPKHWWDEVINTITAQGYRPVLIGADLFHNRGTVDVTTDGCLDLRNKLTLMGTAAVLHSVNVVLTNDSSPLHIAASGNAWIGFCSTIKEGWTITHWREGQFGYKMKDFATGGMYQHLNLCPNNPKGQLIDNVDPNLLESWLPVPNEFANWAVNKVRVY